MSAGQEYHVFDDFLPLPPAEKLAVMIGSEHRWKLHEESFFSQYDFTWARRTFDRPAVGQLTPELTLLCDTGARLIETELNAVVGECYTVIGHKMVPGQIIGIHNDSPDNDRGRIENYRLLYYVDREFTDTKGGHLILFGSNGSDVADAIRPLFNSAVIMRLSDHSFHAVSRVKQGVRYSIVVSYWGYPLLFRAEPDRERVARCIRRLIRAGFEDRRHGNTTFAYHLYHSFRLLVEWGMPVAVCLAGLMHSVLGRKSSGVPPSDITRDELRELIGDYALRLVETLQSNSALSRLEDLGNEMRNDALFVELANQVEQMENEADCARMSGFMKQFTFIPPTVEAAIAAQMSCVLKATEARSERLIHCD